MKTKTIKELLILLRDFLPTNIKSTNKWMGGSLCFSIADLLYNDMITLAELNKLHKYIMAKKPPNAGNYKTQGIKGFWWPYKKLAPRMEFLNKLISEL